MSTEQAEAIRRYFATDRNLRIHEETHANYAVPRVDFACWTLDTLNWTGDEVILDIGAGTGRHYARLLEKQPGIRYYALDFSPYLLQMHPSDGACLTLGDAMELPYAADSFDVVMANHMLYHLKDIDGALAEIKRVLKPAGRMLASTDSLHTLPELQVLLRRAIMLLGEGGARAQPPALPCESFALENGTRILSQHFYAVVRHDLPCELIFTDIDPALDYLDSMRDLRQANLPEDVDWDDMMMVVEQQMSQLLEVLGKLEIHIIFGALVASDRGGFIQDFVARAAACA